MGLKDLFKKKAPEIIHQPIIVNEDFSKDINKDFTDVDSLEKAQALYKEEILEPMYLMDERFGGSDRIDNIVYVPPKIVLEKMKVDDILEGLLNNGKRISLNIEPLYRESSFVPCELKITADGDVHYVYHFIIW